MPFIKINESPLIPGTSPVVIHYRQYGTGTPLIFLHGGWGYQIYPFDKQIEAFSRDFRIIIPDRTGYGRSMRIESQPTDFHRRAAIETSRLLDALGIDRAVLWGHSDGAVISVLMGLEEPQRFAGIILEAFHFFRFKPSSREFFEAMAEDPLRLGERVANILSREHGEDYWEKLIVINGHAWLNIANEARHPKDDLYDDKLGELSVPTLLIHGSRDPRTEPDELEAVHRASPQARIHVIEGGGHSPHSESAAAAECNRVAGDFLREVTRACH
ncbi:MAG TPA: alpha/beta hydrolase [Blastocatellia bacterium]|nr:alpha/beta hydrolase [Blastocatellia bacterium]